MIKKIFAIIVLFSICNHDFAQTMDKRTCAKELARITDVPYIPELSGDSLYWNLVIQGKSIVPCLISNLANTTQTNITIPNWGGYYCIGDIAFWILCDIIYDIPLEDIIKENKRYPKSEDITYFSFVTYKKGNRRFLKRKISKWYKENEDRWEWVADTRHYGRTSTNWSYPSDQHPARGYYRLRH